MESEHLVDQIEHIDTLAELTGRDPQRVKEAIEERLAEFDGEEWSEEPPNFGFHAVSARESFDDDALYSLFSNLIRPDNPESNESVNSNPP